MELVADYSNKGGKLQSWEMMQLTMTGGALLKSAASQTKGRENKRSLSGSENSLGATPTRRKLGPRKVWHEQCSSSGSGDEKFRMILRT